MTQVKSAAAILTEFMLRQAFDESPPFRDSEKTFVIKNIKSINIIAVSLFSTCLLDFRYKNEQIFRFTFRDINIHQSFEINSQRESA